jgi:FkbM family methyltransferase
MLKHLKNILTRWFGAQYSSHNPVETTPIADSQPVQEMPTTGEHAHTLMAYDENLYERAKTQWQFGDWTSLAAMDEHSLANHPEGGRLWLLKATAYAQLGQQTEVMQAVRQAQKRGVAKKLIAQLLVSGVYNSLGKTAMLNQQPQKALGYFEQSMVVGLPHSETRLLVNARMQHQNEFMLTRSHQLTSSEIVVEDTPKIANFDNEAIETINYPPHGIKSYAQNFEDVMLWRALWNVENGFYIDVGAWDPVVDSVSKGFYEKGWRGFHVEPVAEYADKIRQDRPDETVYQVLLGAGTGEKTFYHIPETGLSTASSKFAERHRQAGWTVEEQKHPVMTLAQLFDAAGEREIHWLKIDVEGMEDEVLAGWGTHKARPWVVLLEATEPLSSVPSWSKWEDYLKILGYQAVYFDGINKYYILIKNFERFKCLNIPANFFDSYTKA